MSSFQRYQSPTERSIEYGFCIMILVLALYGLLGTEYGRQLLACALAGAGAVVLLASVAYLIGKGALYLEKKLFSKSTKDFPV